MEKKRLMVLGSSILQVPAIKKAKKMGIEVIAVDMNKNAIGFQFADIVLNISTIDIPKVIEAAKKYKIDGILTIASDMPMRTVATVAEELNLIGISKDTAIRATNKVLMRESLKENDVPIPRFFKVYHYKDYLNAVKIFTNKFIVKPADNSGSRGVFLVDNCKEISGIKHAFQYSKKYSRSGEIIVEEFMEGPEVSVESLTFDGNTNIIAITDKLTTGAPKFVEMGHSQPSLLPDKIKKEIEIITKESVNALGIKNGPAHTEIIVTSEGPKVVELGARLGGDNITTHLVPLSTGVDMVKCCIEISLGEKPNITKNHHMGSAIRYFDSNKGIIKNIRGIDEAQLIPGVEQINFVKDVGENVKEIENSTDRIGFIIAQAKNSKMAIEACEKAKSIIQIDFGEKEQSILLK